MTSLTRWNPAAMTLIVPLMIASAILNQQRSADLLLWGQIASIGAVVAAAVITLGTFPDAHWPRLAVGITVALRLIRLGVATEAVVLAYTVAVGALFCAAGAVVLVARPRLVYRQLIVITALCAPVMFLQASGIGGAASQSLRTDLHGDERIESTPALFVGEGAITITTLQARPAGLFSSNNTLSFVMMFVVAAHVARARRAAAGWRDVVVLSVVVLAMAKILFLGLVVALAYMAVTRGAAGRLRALQMAVLTAGLIAIYAYLLPAFFVYNTGADLLMRNLQFRLIDLALASGIPALVEQALDAPADILEMVTDPTLGHQSGYAGIITIVPLIAALAIALLPVFVRGWRYVSRERPAWRDLVALNLLALVMVPLITSFLSAVFLWFMAGAALLPLLVVAEPRFAALFDETDHFGAPVA